MTRILIQSPSSQRGRMDSKEGIILEAALVNFCRYGFKKASVDDIAKDAGVGKGTIYNYFPSKEALLWKVSETEKAKVRVKIDSALEDEDNAVDKFRVYLHTIVSSIHEYLRMYQFTPANFKELFEIKAELCDDSIPQSNEIEPIMTILEFGQESGEFQIENTQKVGIILWKFITQFMVHWIVLPEEDALAEAEEFYQLFTNGLIRR